MANLRRLYTELNKISKEQGPRFLPTSLLQHYLISSSSLMLLRVSDDVFRMVDFDLCEASLDKHDKFLEELPSRDPL